MLRIGLLVDSTVSSKYVYELTTWAQEQTELEISHLVIHHNPSRSSRLRRALTLWRERGPYDILGRMAWTLLVMIERFVLRHRAIHRDHFEAFDLSHTVRGRLTVNPIVSPSGFVYRFSQSDIERIRALGLDVLIRCGSGIFRGAILGACRLGIISFHHGDNRINRGIPAGFWECYHGWPQTGFVIQQLTEELDGGNVLFRGATRTRLLFSLNQAEVYTRANLYLKDLLKKVASSNRLPAFEDDGQIYYQPLFRQPSFHQIVMYGGKALLRSLWRFVRRAIGLRSRWSIALVNGSFERAVLWRSKEVPSPKGRFWADPFLWTKDGTTCCFIEDYVYAGGRGHITALEINRGGAVERGVALKEDFHLSFPFVFEYDGELFMCPESSEARQIRLYSCQEFPLKWRLRAILMDGVCAVDTMIFRRGMKWWMLTNIDRSSTNDFFSELSLYSAASPLAREWMPHPRNPIKVDSFGGRNAGMAFHNGKLYRFGQREGFDQYGEGLMIYEITTLTESEYQERLLQEVLPRYRKGLRGIHHMTSNGSLTVIDQVRLALVDR